VWRRLLQTLLVSVGCGGVPGLLPGLTVEVTQGRLAEARLTLGFNTEGLWPSRRGGRFIWEVGVEERAVSPSHNLCPHSNHGAHVPPVGSGDWMKRFLPLSRGLLVFVGFWGTRELCGLRKAVAAFVPHYATALQMSCLRHGANLACGMRKQPRPSFCRAGVLIARCGEGDGRATARQPGRLCYA
jgi:hypothetical protein